MGIMTEATGGLATVPQDPLSIVSTPLFPGLPSAQRESQRGRSLRRRRRGGFNSAVIAIAATLAMSAVVFFVTRCAVLHLNGGYGSSRMLADPVGCTDIKKPSEMSQSISI